MAYKSGIERLLASSQIARRRLSSFSSSSVKDPNSVSRPALAQCLMVGEEGGWRSSNWKGYEEEFSKLREFRSWSDARDDSDSGNEKVQASGGNRDRSTDSNAMQNAAESWKSELYEARRCFSGIMSAPISGLGYLGGLSVQSSGRSSFSRGAANSAYGAWNTASSRSFSSSPAAAEGAQIAVEGEKLDALQAGLAGPGDAATAVANLPDFGALSEVAAAAADSAVPTALIQYVIDGLHVSTGLPWWLSIAATTVAIRVLVLPIMVYQMKATARLTLMRPELEKLTNHIKETGYDPKVVEDHQARMKALFVKHKTSPFSPMLGAFIQAPLFMCFFFAIRNMAEKMDSFKEGGALWFTDLSTPDPFFIMPVLSGAFFLLTVELGATDGMQGQPMLAKIKMFLRGLAVLLVPLTASFPKALFCYWLTANVCSIIQAAVFKQPGVKAALGIPDASHLAKPADLPVTPVLTFSQPPRLKGPQTRTANSKQQRS